MVDIQSIIDDYKTRSDTLKPHSEKIQNMLTVGLAGLIDTDTYELDENPGEGWVNDRVNEVKDYMLLEYLGTTQAKLDDLANGDGAEDIDGIIENYVNGLISKPNLDKVLKSPSNDTISQYGKILTDGFKNKALKKSLPELKTPEQGNEFATAMEAYFSSLSGTAEHIDLANDFRQRLDKFMQNQR